MIIKTIKKKKTWKNKKVLLRLDLNVPIKNGKVLDDFKIKASLDTINYLLKQKANIIILSHLGRPEKVDKNYSLTPIAKRLKELIGEDINLVSSISEAKKHSWSQGTLLMLENLRFFSQEEKNSSVFAKNLASLASVYVNDALAVSHRKHASVDKIKDYLPAYAGILLEKELNNFSYVLKPKKPLVLVMGGIKISTKAALLKNFEKKADYILLGGGLANTFLYAQGYEIGNSVFEKDGKKYISKLKEKQKIILPVDLLVKTRSGSVALRDVDKVRKTDIVCDIGPKTIVNFCKILQKSKTIIWNGPMGKFEEKSFKHGTLTLAIAIATLKDKAFSLLGGGETIKALEMSKMESQVNWVSTGGGAMLSYLSGEEMPGLKKIVK